MVRLVGERIGIGRVSEVFAYGDDRVVKVPNRAVPTDWPAFEAGLCDAAHRAGLPAPAVDGLVEVDGRTSIVFERIDGPSMWHLMLDRPDRIEELARELASLQRRVHSVGLPPGVPDFVDRLVRRIHMVDVLPEADQHEAVARAGQLPRGAALLHGDLHPNNVLMGADGPVVIDWFDASIGHPLADIMRSSILMRPGGNVSHGHLPGATPEVLERLHRAYVAAFATELEAAAPELAEWQALVASGRLAEGAEIDERRLIDMWVARDAARLPAGLVVTTG